MQSMIASLVDRPTRFVGSLVQSQPVYPARRHWEMPALWALILLAAVVRFWGVGSFGLHKPDEDTSALPAVHIVHDGSPRFPSGMFYARAIVQSYLIAGAIELFGQSEWSLRLPSVVSGILLVWLAYYLGRRFLEPPWNMAFVAAVALLPGMIADSQEVRMYIFLSASLAGYMILLLKWERSGRLGLLIGAVFMMLLAIQFQEIAVFSSILLLFPGLANGDGRKLRLGLLALLATALGYGVMSHLVRSFYPVTIADKIPSAGIPQTGRAPDIGALRFELWSLIPTMVIAVALTWYNVRSMARYNLAAIAGALLYLGFLAQALFMYHLAAILLATGLVVARRDGGARPIALALLTVGCLMQALWQWQLLQHAHIGSLRKIVGVLVGEPSVWPYLQVAAYSPVAMLLLVGALLAGLWHLSGGGKIRDDVLFAMLGVFVPLFGIGFFGWYIPPRYGEFALLPMLLCALAAAQGFARQRSGDRRSGSIGAAAALATLVCLAIVNPLAVAHSINDGKTFIDHRAAARYVQSLNLGPHDVVVAEEVLMQTYYLGHIDYWLTGPAMAASFSVAVDRRLFDEYTGTPVIDSAAEFHQLINRLDRGAIYVIGSGEEQQDGRLQLRGAEISQLLKEPEFETVFVAPDGLTRVWKIAAPSAMRQPAD